MGAEDNGLTLQVQGLAQRLEALTEKLGGLERENTELRSKVDTLEGSGTRRNEPAETSSLVPRRNEPRHAGKIVDLLVSGLRRKAEQTLALDVYPPQCACPLIPEWSFARQSICLMDSNDGIPLDDPF